MWKGKHGAATRAPVGANNQFQQKSHDGAYPRPKTSLVIPKLCDYSLYGSRQEKIRDYLGIFYKWRTPKLSKSELNIKRGLNLVSLLANLFYPGWGLWKERLQGISSPSQTKNSLIVPQFQTRWWALGRLPDYTASTRDRGFSSESIIIKSFDFFYYSQKHLFACCKKSLCYLRCTCATKCLTNKCKCKNAGRTCNSRCHKNLSCDNH